MEQENLKTKEATKKESGSVGKNALRGLKIWAIILSPILLLTVFAMFKSVIAGDTNYLLNASDEVLYVTFESTTDGKDYSYEVAPQSDYWTEMKRDVYRFTVKNVDGQVIREIEEYSLENMEKDARYIDLEGKHTYLVIDVTGFYLKFYEDANDEMLEEVFGEDVYRETFSGENAFYLEDKMNWYYTALEEKMPEELDDVETAFIIMAFDEAEFEGMTEDELQINVIEYVMTH